MSAKMNRLPGEGVAHSESPCWIASACVGEYPNHGTQAARFLSLLLTGREVGPMEGWDEIGVYRLADTRFQLKEAGWKVQNKTQKGPNRFGEMCGFACYSMPAEVIEAAGEEGQEFARREAELMAEMLSERRGLS